MAAGRRRGIGLARPDSAPLGRSSMPSALLSSTDRSALALAGGAAAALVVGWVRPAPWLLALLLVAILSVLWVFAVNRFLRADAWGAEQSHLH